MLHDYLASMLGASSSPWVQGVAIILGTFILEDATTVLAAFEVSVGALSPATAVIALYIGVALGDFGLYWGGRLAARHPWVRRWVRIENLAGASRWFGRHAFAAVLATRFLPGARLPTYTAYGFLGVSFRSFAMPVVIGTLVWTSLLFGVSLEFGNLVLARLGEWRWFGAIFVVIAVVATGRRVARQTAGSPTT
ncbi:MAG: DedA family protein [Alphaproteobacteria bacterium]|nr:DedA family protein [Alphaproteobacteria bacterium]